MTTKKNTPSGAQSSTSARTTNRPARPKGKPASDKKGKDEGSEVTAERLRAFLAHPDVKENVKDRVKRLVGELYEAGMWDTLPEEPEMYMLEFQQTYINDHLARGTAEPAEREIYDRLAAVINRHEPKDAALVRRLSEVLRDPKRDDDREAILDAINNLSNHTYGVYDFHPEVFPVIARVILRESRRSKAGRGRGFVARVIRDSLRTLEDIAGE